MSNLTVMKFLQTLKNARKITLQILFVCKFKLVKHYFIQCKIFLKSKNWYPKLCFRVQTQNSIKIYNFLNFHFIFKLKIKTLFIHVSFPSTRFLHEKRKRKSYINFAQTTTLSNISLKFYEIPIFDMYLVFGN